ncbi:MAG: DUF1707 domain-containing protein [Nocardioides sp.]|nr:DUF1707 domain-containing protein [Nocardioides sp.]
MVDDPSQLRISDDDRHKVTEMLRTAAGEGRLEVDELDERIEATYSAKIYADLVPIVADLPGASTQTPVLRPQDQPVRKPTGLAANAPHHRTSFVVMGGQDRKGVWEVGPNYNAFVVMGGVDIDLREAIFAEREVEIMANCIMGGIEIVVNAHTHVIVDGVGIMGDFGQTRDKVDSEVGPDSPVVRVKGVALMGSVNITRRPMPGEKRQRRRRLH